MEEDSSERKSRKDTESEVSPASISKKQLILLAGSLFIALSGVSSVVFYFLFSGDGKKESATAPDRVQVLEIEDPDEILSGAVLSLEPFIINLKGNSGILHLVVSLEFYDFNLPSDIEARTPALRDYIITKASDRYARDLLVNGSEKLKEVLLEEINERVSGDNPITNVYIEHLLIR